MARRRVRPVESLWVERSPRGREFFLLSVGRYSTIPTFVWHPSIVKPRHVNVYDNGYGLIHPIDGPWIRGTLGQKVKPSTG
jgi:hypothetical protein